MGDAELESWYRRWQSKPENQPIGDEPYPDAPPEPQRISVKVSSPLIGGRYRDLYRAIARRNIVQHDVPFFIGGEADALYVLDHRGMHRVYLAPEAPPTSPPTMKFRYPPLVRDGGFFSVFGPLARLRFGSASGRARVGGQPVDVGPRQTLELKELKALHRSGPVPVPLEAGDNQATFAFDASSLVAIDGKEQGSFATQHADKLNLILLILSIIGGTAALISGALTVVARARQDRDPFP
jgi:hypothetical protein